MLCEILTYELVVPNALAQFMSLGGMYMVVLFAIVLVLGY